MQAPPRRESLQGRLQVELKQLLKYKEALRKRSIVQGLIMPQDKWSLKMHTRSDSHRLKEEKRRLREWRISWSSHREIQVFRRSRLQLMPLWQLQTLYRVQEIVATMLSTARTRSSTGSCKYQGVEEQDLLVTQGMGTKPQPQIQLMQTLGIQSSSQLHLINREVSVELLVERGSKTKTINLNIRCNQTIPRTKLPINTSSSIHSLTTLPGLSS